MANPNPSVDPAVVGEQLVNLANRVAQDTASVFQSSPDLDTVAALASRTSTAVDKLTVQFLSQRTGPPIVCKEGCSWCCYEVVLASAPEILGVYHDVKTRFSDAEKAALLDRLGAYEEALAGKRDKPFTLVRTPCPLLVEGKCSAYGMRPLECRGKNSEDATICRMWAQSPIEARLVPTFQTQKLAARAGTQGLTRGRANLGSSSVHEFARCLHMLMQNPGLAEDIIAGRATFPAVVAGARPITFPADAVSVSPPFIEDRAYEDVLDLVKYGQLSEANSRIDAHSPTGVFMRIRTPLVYSSFDQIEEQRARFSSALDDLESNDYRPSDLLPLLGEYTVDSFPYQGLPVKSYMERFGRLVHDKIVSKVYPHLCAPIETKRNPGPFRLGYISGTLMLNNGSKWALGWLKHQRSDIETHAINLGSEDIASKVWAHYADKYYALNGNVQRIAEFIRNLDLDALIITEIGFRKRDYIYFAMRLARAQYTAWGVPSTSGLPTVDYYLGSDYMEPEGAEEEYTEQLIRLPRSGLTLLRPETKYWEGEFYRESPDFFPFMAQNLRKWTPQRDDLLKRVADRFGKPLRFISAFDDQETAIFTKRLTRAGVAHELLPPMSSKDYALTLASADVSFDPIDWSGGNTTVEALSYGVPVVSLPGPYMRGRHSLAFLRVANLDGLIAKNEEDYIDMIFNDERRMAAMSEATIEALYEDKGVVEAVEEHLFRASPDFK